MRYRNLTSAIALAALATLPAAVLANDGHGPMAGHDAAHSSGHSSDHAPGHSPDQVAAQINGADRARLEANVRFLADDSLEGRETGTTGYELAAGYVAGQLAAMGVAPGGENGTYFQTVPLIVGKSTGAQGSVLELGGKDLPTGLTFGDDFVTYGKVGSGAGEVEGDLVFVSYGFAADGYERDDFAGVDLNGKIAVVLRGSHSDMNSEEQAHFRSTMNERLSERGAIATIMLFTPKSSAQFPFSAVKRFVSGSTSMDWRTADGKVFSSSPNIMASAIVSPELSEKLFAGQPVTWDQLVEFESGESDTIQSFDMGISAKIAWDNTSELSESRNVLGFIPGTDPALKDEIVIVTAHLDHTGKDDDHGTAAEDGAEGEVKDGINNGAMDNATGTASMLEVARLLAAKPARRPVLVVALTAEEKGLVGSDYMARNPLPMGGKPVANINLDMPIVTYELMDVVAFGAERTTMIGPITQAVEKAGMKLSPDPIPEQGLFTRSDQYSFVQQGVPSLFLVTGHANGGREAQSEFLGKHYHKPSDEVGLVDFQQLKRFADVNHDITRSVADMEQRPVWLKGDFFGRAFGGEMQE
ncbi:M28 family peptidase [Altererythrobacter aquiaggeris]|uniref:M28 family peptidase n=1 Tax=Aestuarierythrobacter aquiaggeris TaxID=1898396 RepID=UPI00301AFDA0